MEFLSYLATLPIPLAILLWIVATLAIFILFYVLLLGLLVLIYMTPGGKVLFETNIEQIILSCLGLGVIKKQPSHRISKQIKAKQTAETNLRLYNELLGSLHGDRKEAQRLINLERQIHPNMSIGWHIYEAIKKANSKKRTKNKNYPLTENPIKITSPNDPKKQKLKQQLLSLVKNDAPTAKRLLELEIKKNPGYSDIWYLEKVIHQLLRDRK